MCNVLLETEAAHLPPKAINKSAIFSSAVQAWMNVAGGYFDYSF